MAKGPSFFILSKISEKKTIKAISRTFSSMVHILEIQQFSEFLESLTGHFHNIPSQFEISEIFCSNGKCTECQ